MHKDDELHIIDYILEKTDIRRYTPQLNQVRHEHRKYRHDDVIKLCNYCEHLWSPVPHWVDKSLFRIYPKDIIPKIGKKKKKCPKCEKLNRGNK